jgi:hypothetical protein
MHVRRHDCNRGPNGDGCQRSRSVGAHWFAPYGFLRNG